MNRAFLFLLAIPFTAIAAPPLAGLPSPAGAHIEKIRALGVGEWLDLGAPAADAKWGRARGRSWAGRMTFAPELRGAFLTGEGVHGYVKPDGHYMDDVWFYDANAHRWLCVYPGADTRSLTLKLDANGFEAAADGEPIPVAQLGHAYENATYDTDLRRFMFMPCPVDYWKKSLGERRAQWLPADAKRPAASPWFYEVASGKFARRVASKAPHSGFGDTFIYLPKQERAFFRHTEDVWFYDIAANEWTDAKPTGPKPPFGIDATACLDAKRGRIYIGGGSYPVTPEGKNALWIYDLKTNAWLDPQPSGSCGGSNKFNTNISAMHYDPVADAVLIFRRGGDESGRGVWLYDPAKNAWAAEPVARLPKLHQCVNTFYDPELNAYFLHHAGDSNDNGTVQVFRFRAK